jgi:diguanylate cyclase (GGDEF)-like protein
MPFPDPSVTPPSASAGASSDSDLRRAVLDAEQTIADAQQRASDSDQTAADVDQVVSDRARDRSDRDRYLSDADQRASDRDQALADSHGMPGGADQPARDAARAAREQTSAARALTATMREQTDADRFAIAEERDEAARVRDRASTARDLEAAARDAELGQDERGPSAAARRRAAEDRLQAADDREQNSVDRDALRAALSQTQFDDLTGTYRRASGNVALQAEIDRAHRSDRPLVLAFVDVDNLKTHNDQGGHAEGDAVLLEVVSCIRSNLRSYDPVVRFGGDEFVCAMSDADMGDAEERFREIRLALEEVRPGASFSVGLARLRLDESLDELLMRGDAELYAAKQASGFQRGPDDLIDEVVAAEPAGDPLLNVARLSVVRELGSFKGRQQEGLCRLSNLAVLLLDVPVSTVSIMDESHQIVIAHAGLAEDGDGPLEVPMSETLCQHVVRDGVALAIPDLRIHPLGDGVGDVIDDSVVAYAGLPLKLSGGEVVGTLCAISDVPRAWSTRDLETLGELAALAVDQLEYRRASVAIGTRDPVTGLPRLALFTEHLRTLLADRPADDESVTVVVADLAGFRLLNDAWGYQVGDAILAEIARRLESIAGHYGERGSVCRIDGDVFLLAAAISSVEQRETLVAYVRRSITGRPVEVEGLEQPIDGRVSAITSHSGVTPSELINAAGAAALGARQLGRSSDVAAAPVGSSARERLRIRNALEGADRRGELSLNYQPLMALSSGRIGGFEALLRWNHP